MDVDVDVVLVDVGRLCSGTTGGTVEDAWPGWAAKDG